MFFVHTSKCTALVDTVADLGQKLPRNSTCLFFSFSLISLERTYFSKNSENLFTIEFVKKNPRTI